MATRDDVDLLLHLLDSEHPDEVDVFEDELARRLGYVRHPTLSYDTWRRRRVTLLEGADSRAEEEGLRLEDELLG